jgi:hypothetical protein
MQVKQLFKKSNKYTCLLIGAALILTGAALHHGWANYDQDNELEYIGIILDNDIGNPHTYIDLEVLEDGKVWDVVLAPLTRMRNRGLTDDSMLAVGDTVTVVGYPHREIEDEMRAERIIIGDTTIELR